MATLLDWGNVEAALARIQKQHGLTDRSEALTLLCVTTLLRLDFDEARGCMTDGGDDRGVDAVYLDERFGRRIIHLFQMKCHGSYNRSSRNFPSSEIDKLLSFITDCFSQVEGFEGTCNPLLRQKVFDIWEFVNTGPCSVEVHLCSNGERLLDDQRARFEASLARFKFVELYEPDLDELSNRIAMRMPADRSIQLRVVEEQVFERTDGNVRAVIGTVRADEFIEAFTDPTKKSQLDPALFEENVRVYLGEQNEINKRIFDTAISNEAGLFWYFNNGITIVCENFSYQPGFRNAPLTLVNPQVVNGGQTSHALFQASKTSLASLQRVRLLVRIIETKDKSLYAKVAEATNSQTPIRSRDLRSNDPTLIRLEASLLSHGWLLDRKRDQHSEVSEAQRIDALKLGQVWLAYVRGEPDKAKTASDRIFGEYFTLVFDPTEMDAQRVISIWRLYLAMDDIRRREIAMSRRQTRARSAREIESFWVIEGLYHLAFAIRKLADRAGIDMYDFERVQPLIADAKKRLDIFVEQRPGVSFYRLFRTASTKESLYMSALDDRQLPLDLGINPLGEGPSN